jgi:hypothetical protein
MGKEALARIFVIDADPETERARAGLMTVVVTESRQFPELRSLVHELGGEPSRRLLVKWLQRQEWRGRLSTTDADVIARMVMDVVFGAVSINEGGGSHSQADLDRSAYRRLCFSTIARGLGSTLAG